jgi:ubiquinone biosynthesis protein
LRFDLLPEAYCRELFALLNQVRPVPYVRVREIIRQELGADPEQVFRSFDPRPFAAASIGQVHRAVLPSGAQVAVKVQRPRIRRAIATDVSLMYFFAGIVDRTGLLGAPQSRQVVDEFARWTVDELDYRVEARHARVLGRNAAGDLLEHNARMYEAYSSARVLTTEFLHGVPVIDIVTCLRAGDTAFQNTLAQRGYDLEAIATHLAWNCLNQVYDRGYFHADLHPANLIVLPGNVIGYVDFGIVGQVSDAVRRSLAFFASNLYSGNVDRATEEFLRWAVPSENTDVETARQQFREIMADYSAELADHGTPNGTPGRDASSLFEVAVLAAIRRNAMVLSPSIVLYLKAVLTVEAVVYELDPGFDLQTHENTFFSRLLAERTQQQLDPRAAVRTLSEYVFRLDRALDTLDTLGLTPGTLEQSFTRTLSRLELVAIFGLPVAIGLYLFVSRAGLTTFGLLASDWIPIMLAVALVLLLMGVLNEGHRAPANSAEGRRRAARRQVRSRLSRPPT